ncbi:hypothetical protein BU17DRAFT_83391 [Hysterangium stoloniferum]|nr:hypothetical protein BU17DRAFT_83391 [Hysterangium stoloniferum]
MQAEGPSELHTKPEALLLTAACLWLINGLHSRPDDGSADRKLMEAILPLTEVDDQLDHLTLMFTPRGGYRLQAEEEEEEEEDGEEEVELTPWNPYGVIYIRRLVIKEVPRFRTGGPSLTVAAFQAFFKASQEEIHFRFNKTGILPPGVLPSTRIVTNKTKLTPTYIPDDGDGVQETIFNLSERGIRIPDCPVDSGSDMDEENDNNEPDSFQNADECITFLW